MEDVKQSKGGKLGVQENCDITYFKNGADQVLSMAKDGVMVEGHHSMAEGTGDMMAAMYDPTYNYRNHYNH